MDYFKDTYGLWQCNECHEQFSYEKRAQEHVHMHMPHPEPAVDMDDLADDLRALLAELDA